MNNLVVAPTEPHLIPPHEKPHNPLDIDNDQPPTETDSLSPNEPLIENLPSNPVDALKIIADSKEEIISPSENLVDFKERLLNEYKGYEGAHKALKNLLEYIPEEELKILQETGQLERILKYYPDQEFRNQDDNALTRAYDRGKRIMEKVPERWTDRANHYLRETSGFDSNTNPGLNLTEQLLTIAGSKSGNVQRIPLGSMDPVALEVVMATIERVSYAADIVTLAQSIPVNIDDMSSWTVQPNKQLFYPKYIPSPVYDDIIPEIRRVLETSPDGKVDLVALQNNLSPQDDQFKGTEGLGKINSIIGAIKIYKEVFE